ERESIREEVRLLYVAATRAELACWVGAAAVIDGQTRANVSARSGFGRLLGGGAEQGAANLREAVGELAALAPAIYLLELPEVVSATRAAAPAPLQSLVAPRMPAAPRAPAWWLSSYSALIRGPKGGGVDVGSAAETVPL